MKILTFGEFKKSYHVNFKAKEEDEEFIGRGGYGAVFKGYYIKGNQEVAIKRSDTDKKLLDEVEMAAKVPTHPNIARYLDGFRVDSEADDFDVAILQYYPKGNLGDLFFNDEKKVKLSEKQVDGLLKGVLEGLLFLHEGFKDSNNEHIRIIHRDLKPQNILIAEYKGNYTPLITDFGVSKLVNEQDFLSTGKFELTSDAGTLVYKAPEQIRGEIAKSNLDLWAFGVMVFKILTKKLPFFTDASPSTDAFKMEIMSKITNSDLEDVFVQVNDQPQKYQQLIKRCLVRDIRDRVQTAQELIDILNEIPEKLAVANALLAKNDYEKAKEKFEELLQINPNYSHAKKGLKDCEDLEKEEANIIEKLEIAYNFLNEKKYKEAEGNFEIVLKKHPNQENALRGVQECNEAIKKANDISATLSLAKSLVQEQKYFEAKSQFEFVFGLDANNFEAKEGIKNCDNEIKKRETLEELLTDEAIKPVSKTVVEPPTDEAKLTPKTEPDFIIVPTIEKFTVTPQKVKQGGVVDISWRVKGDADEIKIKSSNLSFDKKVATQGYVSIMVQNETVFTIEVIYGGHSKTKSDKVEVIIEETPISPIDKSLWNKLKIPVSVVGTSLVLYFGYTRLNQPSSEHLQYGVVIKEKPKVIGNRRSYKRAYQIGDSLFAVGSKQLDNGTDKMIVSNTFREAINFEPSLKSDVYKLFMGKADKLKNTAPTVSEKYRKLADEFK